MMIFNVECIKVAFLIYFVHGVACFPNPKVDNRNDKDAPNGVKKQVNVPNSENSQQDTKSKDSHKYQREGDPITGNIDINVGVVEGHIELPDNINEELKNAGPIESVDPIKSDDDQQNVEANSNNEQEKGGVTEKIQMHQENSAEKEEMDRQSGFEDSDESHGGDADTISSKVKIDNDGNVKGVINIPDNDDNGQLITKFGNKSDDAITGSLELKNDGSIEGTINIPDGAVNDQPGAENTGNKNQGGGDDAITGSLELKNDGSIEGTINIPDDAVNDQPGAENNSNENQDGGDDAITGSIELKNDGSIEGTINIPNEAVNDQPGAENNGNENQDGGDDAITGSIELKNDGSIEGTINIPDEAVNDQPGAENNGNENQDGGDDAITGSIELKNDGSIEGTINIPDEDENDKKGGNKQTDAENGAISGEVVNKPSKNSHKDGSRPDKKNCWMNLNSKQYLDALNEIEAKYSKARHQYQDEIGPDFDKQMMEVLLSSQGKAPRAVHQAHGNPNVIPAGLNLGGFGMMRMPGSMLFFHRMKLRNSTVFNVDFLQADLMDMTLIGRLSLNDLHLHGSYERAVTKNDLAQLYFNPSYGELDVLIKSVYYKMEGRLRLLSNRLMIELINSDMVTQEILLSYANSSAVARNIAADSIEDFVSRMKCDIDLWLKDYFNDYLMYFGIVGGGKNSEIQLYEKEKTIKANEYADHAIKGIKMKLRDIKAANVKLPSFTFLSVLNHRIELKNGILRGLDSLYRRSVAMTKKSKTVRTLDIMIGFSNLKVQYQYEATVIRGMPPLAGQLILTADELAAHLEISQVDESQTVDLNVDSIIQLKSEALTVEGPANRLIADFKYILENPIIAIMTNVMKHNIKMLKTLTRCEPNLWGEGSENNSQLVKNEDNFIPPDNTVTQNDPEMTAFSDEEDKTNDKVKPANKEWSDYTFSKNDSVEVEVPVNGKIQKMKLNRNENFVLSKLP